MAQWFLARPWLTHALQAILMVMIGFVLGLAVSAATWLPKWLALCGAAAGAGAASLGFVVREARQGSLRAHFGWMELFSYDWGAPEVHRWEALTPIIASVAFWLFLALAGQPWT